MREMLQRTVGILTLAVILDGCDGAPRSITGPAPYPVTGQLLVDGSPAEGVIVRFIPVAARGKSLPVASGLTDSQGIFTLSTYNPSDGAPAGRYNVSFSWIRIVDVNEARQNQPASAEQMPARYRNHTTSGVTAHVDEGRNDLAPFEITTKESHNKDDHHEK